MRLFWAVFPPQDVVSSVVALESGLKAPGAEVNWSGAVNLHFTLRFMGEVQPGDLGRLKEAGRRIAAGMTPFTAQVAGTGTFPERGDPRVIWAGAGQGRDSLVVLARGLENQLAACGFTGSDQPFKPHLTLGRVRGLNGLGDLRALLLAASDYRSPAWTVESFALVQSVLSPQGARYTNVSEFAFSGSL